MPEPTKISAVEFAAKIKAKYPEYQDISDVELAQKMVAKYPEYVNVVELGEPQPVKKKDVGQPVSGLAQQPTPSPSIPKGLETYLTQVAQQPITVERAKERREKPYVPLTEEQRRQEIRTANQQRQKQREEIIANTEPKLERIDALSKDIARLELSASNQGIDPNTLEPIKTMRQERNNLRLEVADQFSYENPNRAAQMRAAATAPDVKGAGETYDEAFMEAYVPVVEEYDVTDQLKKNTQRLAEIQKEEGMKEGLELYESWDETLGVASYLPKLVVNTFGNLIGETQKIINYLVPQSLENDFWINASENSSEAFKVSMGFSEDEMNQSFTELIEDGKYQKGLGLFGAQVAPVVLQMMAMAEAQGAGNLLKGMSALERETVLANAYSQSFAKGAAQNLAFNLLENPVLSSSIFLLGAGNGYDQIKDNPNATTLEKSIYPIFTGGVEMFTEMAFMTNLQLYNRVFDPTKIDVGKKAFMDGFKKSARDNAALFAQSGLEEGVLEEGLAFYANAFWDYMSTGKKPNPREFWESAIIAAAAQGPATLVNIGKESVASYKLAHSPRHYLPTLSEIDKGASLKSELVQIDKALANEDLGDQERQILTDARIVVAQQIEEQKIESLKTYSLMSAEDRAAIVEIHAEINSLIESYQAATTPIARKAIGEQVKELAATKKEIEERYDSEKEAGIPSAVPSGEAAVQAEPVAVPSEEAPEAGGVLQAPAKEGTLGTLVNERVVYRDPVSETLVEGDMFIEGQRVIIEEEGGRQFDIGNVEEILTQPITDESVVQPATLAVVPQEDGSFVFNIKGDRKVPYGTKMVNTQPGLQAITRSKDGQASRVTLYSEDGKNTYNLRGQQAVDAAYYIVRNFVESAEGQQELANLLETNEAARQDLTKALERLARIPQVAEEAAAPVRPEAPAAPIQEVRIPINPTQTESVVTPVSEVSPEARQAIGDAVVMRIGNILETPNVDQEVLRKINKAVNVLYSVLPDVTVVIHRNQDSIANSHQKASQDTEGYYSRATRQIHILAENLEEGITANEERVLRHEIIHPILDALIKESPVFTDNMSDEIIKILNLAQYKGIPAISKLQTLSNDITEAIRRGDLEGAIEAKKELITEFFAQFSEEKNFNALSKNPSLLDKVKALLNKLLGFLGFKYRVRTSADLLDTLKKFKASFDQGKAFDVASTTDQAQAIDSISQSVRPAPFQRIEDFLAPNPGDYTLSILSKDQLETLVVEQGTSRDEYPNITETIPLLNKLTELTNIPYIFVDLTKSGQIAGVVDFNAGARYQPLNVELSYRVVGTTPTYLGMGTDVFNEIASNNGYESLVESPVGYMAIDVSSPRQSVYSYAAMFLELIKQKDIARFNKAMESVVKERYSGSDQVIIRAREILEEYVQNSPTIAAINRSQAELENIVTAEGFEKMTTDKEILAQAVYVSLSSALYEAIQDATDIYEAKALGSQTAEDIRQAAADMIGEELQRQTNEELADVSLSSDLGTIAAHIFSPALKADEFKTFQTDMIDRNVASLINGLSSSGASVKDKVKKVQREISEFYSEDASVTQFEIFGELYNRAMAEGLPIDQLEKIYEKAFIANFSKDNQFERTFIFVDYSTPNKIKEAIQDTYNPLKADQVWNDYSDYIQRERSGLSLENGIKKEFTEYTRFIADFVADLYAVSQLTAPISDFSELAKSSSPTALYKDLADQYFNGDTDDVEDFFSDKYSLNNRLTQAGLDERSLGLFDVANNLIESINKDFHAFLDFNGEFDMDKFPIGSLFTLFNKLNYSGDKIIRAFNELRELLDALDRLDLIPSGTFAEFDELAQEINTLGGTLENGSLKFYEFKSLIGLMGEALEVANVVDPTMIKTELKDKFGSNPVDNRFADKLLQLSDNVTLLNTYTYGGPAVNGFFVQIKKSGYDGGFKFSQSLWGGSWRGALVSESPEVLVGSLFSLSQTPADLLNQFSYIRDEEDFAGMGPYAEQLYDRYQEIKQTDSLFRDIRRAITISDEVIQKVNILSPIEDFEGNPLIWISEVDANEFVTGDISSIQNKLLSAPNFREIIAIANSKEVRNVAPDFARSLTNSMSRGREVKMPVKFNHPDKWYVEPSFRGRSVDGYYLLSLSLGSNGYVNISYKTSEYYYDNVPPYLMKDRVLANMFLNLATTISKSYPDLPINGIEFQAISESPSTSMDGRYYFDAINDAAADVNHPHHEEAKKLVAETAEKAYGNFRRVTLNNIAFNRSVSKEFVTQTKPYKAFGTKFQGLFLVRARNQDGTPGPIYTKFNAASILNEAAGFYSDAAAREDVIPKLEALGLVNGVDFIQYLDTQTAEEVANGIPGLKTGNPDTLVPRLGHLWNESHSGFSETIRMPNVYKNYVDPIKLAQTPARDVDDVSFSNRLSQSVRQAAQNGLENQERMQQEYLDEVKKRGKSVGTTQFVKDLMSPDKGVFWDRQAGVKRKVRKIEKEEGVPYLEDLIVTRAGAQGYAFAEFRQVEQEIYGGLNKAELDILDRIIFNMRVIQIENNRENRRLQAESNIQFSQQAITTLKGQLRGADPAKAKNIKSQIVALEQSIKLNTQIVKENQPNVNENGQPLHPNGQTRDNALAELNGFEQELGYENYSKLGERAALYFAAFSEDLRKNYEAGRINEETYLRFKDQNYQPRLFLEKMFGPEDITYFEAKGMKPEYIKGIKGGSDLSIFTDSRALLAMQMQAASRAIAENRANSELAKFASPKTAEWLRPANYSRDAQGQIIKDDYGNYKVEPADKGFVNLFFREEGSLRAMQMKAEDYRQWQDLEKSYFNLSPSVKALFKGLSLSPILKLQATGINPLFGLFQMPADFVRVVLTRGRVYDDLFLPTSLLKAAGDLTRGLYAATKESNELYRDWIKHGGAMQFLFQYGTDTKARIINKHRGDVARRLFKIKDLTFSTLSFLNNATEVGMRLAIYQRAIKTLQKEYPNLDIETIKFMAASESRKFADFHQGGALSKDIDNLAAYFNAGVVTTKATLDGIKNNPVLFAGKIGQMFLFISGLMAYNLSYFDDDDWDDIPDWEKSRYHIILLPFLDEDGNRMYIRIKKDYAMMPFFTMAEMASESSLVYSLTGKKKEYSDQDIRRIFELNSQSIPFFIPGLDKPSSIVSRVPSANLAIKYFGNYDTFRNRVVSPDKKDDLPEYLEGAYDEKVEYFYKALGYGAELSPARLKAAAESVILSPSSSEVTNLAYFLADYVAMSTYDLPYDVPESKLENVMDVSLKNLERNTVMRGMRSVNPDWKTYIQQEEGEVKRIKQVEAEEDFIIRKELGLKAKRDAEKLKEGQGIPSGLPQDVREYVQKLPEQKRKRAANTYTYQLRSKHFKLDAGYYPILFARTSTEAAKQFELFVGSTNVNDPEVKEAIRDLTKAGFYVDKEFKFALSKLNKESKE